MTVILYIEGGGDNRRLAAQFREGWASFFKAAGLQGRMPRVMRGGSRQQTFQRFATDATNRRAGIIPLLLVDSEAPIEAGRSAWEHLYSRDGWRKPASASDDDAFLMVQVMETWFLADRDALRRYFGPRLEEGALEHWPDLEDVPKATVLNALRRATAGCSKSYSKGKVSFQLLARLDPSLIEAACSYAKVLLERLRHR